MATKTAMDEADDDDNEVAAVAEWAGREREK